MATITQKEDFKAPVHDIFELIMDEDKHSAFTKSKATVSRDIGGKFTAYDGYIDGENVEIVPDKKIVQKWHGKDWQDGHYSTATFDLEETEDGTRLTFTQEGVPEDKVEDITNGWKEHYWDRIKEYLESRNAPK